MRFMVNVFATIGLVCVVGLILGAILDLSNIDRTSGGYEPPYEGVTGEPIDWSALDKTSTGLVRRGYVVDTHVHGRTGMISFEIFKVRFHYRPLSERALVVHKAREGIRERGFDPEF